MAGGHVLDLTARISGRSFPISAIRVREFCESTQFKADRVAQWGFKAPYTLAEGLARTVEAEFGSGRSLGDGRSVRCIGAGFTGELEVRMVAGIGAGGEVQVQFHVV